MKKTAWESKRSLATWMLVTGCVCCLILCAFVSCGAKAEMTLETETGILHYSDGAMYAGEYLPGSIRSGVGTYTWSTGEVYTGSWQDDQLSGEGKMTWPGLGVYEGSFENGKRQGEGMFTWMYDGAPEEGQPISFQGLWEKDKIGASGTLILAGTGTYVGEFARQSRNGEGTFTWENGDVYTGKWINDAISGNGTLTLADGTILEGQFSNGTLSRGTVTYAVTRGTAVRNVTSGKVQAQTTITYEDGTIVSGRLKENAFEGSVTITYASGDTYVGTLVYGVKDGKGTYTWKNGAHYVGEWFNDQMCGTGKYYYTSNETHTYLSGSFQDGLPEGKLTYVSDKKLKYSTTWSNGKCTSIQYVK